VKESLKEYTIDMAPNASVMFHLECRGTEPIKVAMKDVGLLSVAFILTILLLFIGNVLGKV
jgi:hypothetical protein